MPWHDRASGECMATHHHGSYIKARNEASNPRYCLSTATTAMAANTALRILVLLASLTQGKWIVPGAQWIDTEGDVVNAHAGCVTKDPETGRFYLFGEYKTEEQPEGGGVSVYSSDDLATWEPHGKALC